MTDKKLIEVFTRYRALLEKNGPIAPKRGVISAKGLFDGGPASDAHLVFMCAESLQFIKDGRRDKAMRWLGFLQGIFAARGVYSVQELGEHSMPTDPLKDVDDNTCRMTLRAICEILYPDGDTEHQWEVEDLDHIANELQAIGVNP